MAWPCLHERCTCSSTTRAAFCNAAAIVSSRHGVAVVYASPVSTRQVVRQQHARRRRHAVCVIEPLNRLKIEADLRQPYASGSFGEVFIGTLKESNERVILKRARESDTARTLLSKERAINRKLAAANRGRRLFNDLALRNASGDGDGGDGDGDGVDVDGTRQRWPQYLGEYVRDSQSFLVWRFQGDGSTLSTYLSGRPLSALCGAFGVSYISPGTKGAQLQVALFRRVVGSLLLAIRDIHTFGVVHRDVKPSNVLVVPQARGNDKGDGDTWVQLIDFGSSCDVSGLFWRAGIHTMDPLYAAPEVRLNMLAPLKFDVFSAGMVGISVLMPSYGSESRMREFRNALQGVDFDLRRYRAQVVSRSSSMVGGCDELRELFDESDEMAVEIFNVLCGMLQKSPFERTSVSGALLQLGYTSEK